MRIALKDREKTPVWNLPGTKIYLTFDSPGPLEIDVAELKPDQKKALAISISRGALVASDTDQLFKDLQPKVPVLGGTGLGTPKSYFQGSKSVGTLPFIPVAAEITPASVQSGTFEEVVEVVQTKKKKDLKSILNKSIGTIKKDLPGRSVHELRILLELETVDKERKSVIDLLNQLISKAQKEVAESISKSTDMKAKTPVSPADLPKKFLGNVEDVVESDSKEVTIRLGADDDREPKVIDE